MVLRHKIQAVLLPWAIAHGSCLHAQSEITTRIPSEAAGTEGLAVRITVPSQCRYSEGAPVVIYMAGGFDGIGISERVTGLDGQGFIEIRFNFPGCGTGANRSGGGPYDNRGPESLKAARDMCRFAIGSLNDDQNRSLAELVAPIPSLHGNVGLVGWSNGGNTNLCLAGIHGQEIPGLAWIVNWESPVGDGMPQAEAGSKETSLRPFNPSVNQAYDPDDGEWDLSSLRYDPGIQVPLIEDQSKRVLGGLYFDITGDALVTPGKDYIPYPLIFETPDGPKGYYSERLRNAADSLGILPSNTPEHIATKEETGEFWSQRNGEYWIGPAMDRLPNLMFMVIANDTDHVQRAADHPHVLIQYEAFRIAGARFVRLNPDRIYSETLWGSAVPGSADNPAFVPFDHQSIRGAVEPGDATDDFGYITVGAAGACELADRTHFDDVRPQLDAVLTGVRQDLNVLPHFHLSQNYPNPFNPSTRIRFDVPEPCRVTLRVYDMLGNEAAVLADGPYPAGNHAVRFNAAGLPSGLYVVRMEAGGFTASRKMVVVK